MPLIKKKEKKRKEEKIILLIAIHNEHVSFLFFSV